MPKLPTDTAKATAEQEGSSFEPLPEGVYVVALNKVEARESKKDKSVYWSWEFEVADGDHKGRRLWSNTSLKDTALWKLKEVFDAFGYTTDSDTDEMVGERIKVAVEQRVIEGGPNAGSIGNNVARHLPLGDDDAEDDESF